MLSSKPHILIAIHYLEIGGVESSLIALLHSLDPKRVDIDLFVYSHQGELMKYIPGHIHLLPESPEYSMFERPMKEVLKRGYFRILIARICAKLRTKVFLKRHTMPGGGVIWGYLGQEVSRVVPDINPNVEYDLAISYLTPHNFVLDHVKARKKICWIHTDYSRVSINADLEFPIWHAYDKIVSISSDVTRTFLTVFPSLHPKIMEMENILDVEFVRKRAKEFKVKWGDTSGCKILLSIGRFCEAKNFENIPDICRRIIDAGAAVKWYIMGYGGGENLIRQRIDEMGVQENVIILGKKENPYPYIKACDIYVQPSRYEGKSVIVGEAQALCKPVAVTNYPTAGSQVKDGLDGVIVPTDNEGCARGLVSFIRNDEQQRDIVNYLRDHSYGNANQVSKIYELIDSGRI